MGALVSAFDHILFYAASGSFWLWGVRVEARGDDSTEVLVDSVEKAPSLQAAILKM